MTANSSVEFLIWLLIAASVIAVIAKRIGIPYTVALVLGGLLLSVVRLPALETTPRKLTKNAFPVLAQPCIVLHCLPPTSM